jgi:imidazolonepropionase-like amidohydrolase
VPSIDSPKCRRARWFALLGFIFVTAFPGRSETILLTELTVHTVTQGIIPAGQVLIKDGLIAAVSTNVAAPADRVIKLGGLHLYPGLIAANTTLGLTEINAVRATRDTTEVGDYTPDVQSWTAINPDSELIPVARANGITHTQPVPLGKIVSGQSGVIALDGWTSEQMAIKRPVALHLFWPDMDLDTTPREQLRDKSKWKSLEDQAKERRVKLKSLEDFFEEARAYDKARSAQKPAPTTPAWEAMAPYVRGELPIMIHADNVRQIKAAVQWAHSNAYKIILVGARDAWRTAELLAEKKVPVVYSHMFSQPTRDVDSYDVQFRAPQVLHQAGVTVTFSYELDGDQASVVRNLPYAAAQAVAFGLPAEEALKGITFYPAQLLGLADRLGSIEAGKEATLFVSDGDILDIRSNVKRMWIAGKEVSLESRHTRLYEKYKQRPKPAVKP